MNENEQNYMNYPAPTVNSPETIKDKRNAVFAFVLGAIGVGVVVIMAILFMTNNNPVQAAINDCAEEYGDHYTVSESGALTISIPTGVSTHESETQNAMARTCIMRALDAPEFLETTMLHTEQRAGSQTQVIDGINYTWHFNYDRGLHVMIRDVS